MTDFPTYDEQVSLLNGDIVPFVDIADRIHYEGDLDKPAQEAFELEMDTVIQPYNNRRTLLMGRTPHNPNWIRAVTDLSANPTDRVKKERLAWKFTAGPEVREAARNAEKEERQVQYALYWAGILRRQIELMTIGAGKV